MRTTDLPPKTGPRHTLSTQCSEVVARLQIMQQITSFQFHRVPACQFEQLKTAAINPVMARSQLFLQRSDVPANYTQTKNATQARGLPGLNNKSFMPESTSHPVRQTWAKQHEGFPNRTKTYLNLCTTLL